MEGYLKAFPSSHAICAVAFDSLHSAVKSNSLVSQARIIITL